MFDLHLQFAGWLVIAWICEFLLCTSWVGTSADFLVSNSHLYVNLCAKNLHPAGCVSKKPHKLKIQI